MVARVSDAPGLVRAWLEQAEADLRAAEDSAKDAHHEWAFFQAQQSGEKALKALLYSRGRTSIRPTASAVSSASAPALTPRSPHSTTRLVCSISTTS